LLSWREWRFISRNAALVDWRSREAEKRELLLRSAQRVKAWKMMSLVSAILLCCGWAVWEFQPDVSRWRTQQELLSSVKLISDGNTLAAIATDMAEAGLASKSNKLVDSAVIAAEHTSSPQMVEVTIRRSVTTMLICAQKAKVPTAFEPVVATAMKQPMLSDMRQRTALRRIP
jgi:hypothetical protein